MESSGRDCPTIARRVWTAASCERAGDSMGECLCGFADLSEGISMAEYKKPLPAISSLNAPYWDGLKLREVKLQRCNDCHKLWYPPGPFCPDCWSRSFTWEKLN